MYFIWPLQTIPLSPLQFRRVTHSLLITHSLFLFFLPEHPIHNKPAPILLLLIWEGLLHPVSLTQSNYKSDITGEKSYFKYLISLNTLNLSDRFDSNLHFYPASGINVISIKGSPQESPHLRL